MSQAITLQAFDLDGLDKDGAIRENEAAVAGDSRADFFKKAALGGGALIGGGVLLSGFPALADARPSRRQDIAILNYALTLEYLEAAFYNEALKKGALSGDVLSTTKIVAAHENTHVRFLKDALGRRAVKKPMFDFKNTTGDQATFLATAVVLEDTGVAAYAGQGTRIKSPAIVKAALSIHSVEARHAARYRALNGVNFAPRAFDKALSMRAVLKAVKGTGFITG
ncbi:MAG TPA: ferritin-like domain-containing protein [Thermoleophilaceae bacterium]|nr:ferritin-like domain-containing protein [Thermoleophilaceae bacterium]